MKQDAADLERYLNDHLAGAASALSVLEELISRQDLPEKMEFFARLKNRILEKRALLQDIVKMAGLEESTMLKVAGNVTGGLGQLKLKWEGLEPGKLGMFEALEFLSIGLQGQRLLWRTLGKIAPWYPEWDGLSFADLELEVLEMRDAVEEERLECAAETLASPQRRLVAIEEKLPESS